MRSDHGLPELVYVDLDGTLIQSDLLFESLAMMLREAPWRFLLLPLWLLRGRARLKEKLSGEYLPDATVLPYRGRVLEYLGIQKMRGRRLIMATASAETAAREVAAHLGLFDEVLASSMDHNLKGGKKAARILEHAAGRPFTYVGDNAADLLIWQHAASSILVAASGSVRAEVMKRIPVEAEFDEPRRFLPYVQAIRVHQWLKNFLVFVPLMVAHRWSDFDAALAAVWAFVAFCACASSIYLLNDILDLAADRRHPRKRARPLASGAVPLSHALLLVAPLLASGLWISASLGLPFLAAIGGYVATTLLYSMYFKEYVLIDVFLLAVLYTVRVIAGAAATTIVPSFWLLAFSMFLFFSLALVKRCSELLAIDKAGRSASYGRDYRTADYAVLQSLGVASGIAAVVVFALYIDSPIVVEAYTHPQALWAICGTLAYWVGRMWVKTARGEMHDDPLVYAAKDRASAVMGLISLASFLVAVW